MRCEYIFRTSEQCTCSIDVLRIVNLVIQKPHLFLVFCAIIRDIQSLKDLPRIEVLVPVGLRHTKEAIALSNLIRQGYREASNISEFRGRLVECLTCKIAPFFLRGRSVRYNHAEFRIRCGTTEGLVCGSKQFDLVFDTASMVEGIECKVSAYNWQQRSRRACLEKIQFMGCVAQVLERCFSISTRVIVLSLDPSRLVEACRTKMTGVTVWGQADLTRVLLAVNGHLGMSTFGQEK